MSQNVPKCPTQKKSLSQRQLSAICLLVQGQPDTAVAQRLGLNRRTVYRWRHQPRFQTLIDRLREDIWQNSADSYRTLLPRAVKMLKRLLKDPDHKTNLHAASFILRQAGANLIIPPIDSFDEPDFLAPHELDLDPSTYDLEHGTLDVER